MTDSCTPQQTRAYKVHRRDFMFASMYLYVCLSVVPIQEPLMLDQSNWWVCYVP